LPRTIFLAALQKKIAKMASKDEVPTWLSKAAAKLPEEGQAKLIKLHGSYNFAEDQIDAFNMNAGSITMDNIEDFGHFLERETNKPSKPAGTRAVARPAMGGFMPKGIQGLQSLFGKRKSLGDAEAGNAQASGRSQDNCTPESKRAREGAESDLIRGTPEPPSKVSVKTSVNEQLAKPQLGETATATQIKVLGDSTLWTGPRGGAYRWMDEALKDRAAAQDAQLTAMEDRILAAMRARPVARLSLTDGQDEVAAGTVGVASQAEVVLCGRLVCEGLEGRLNERSILLEGSQASSFSARVQLNLAGCQQIAAFPGQIVGVLGRSGMSGATFHARDFLPGLPIPKPLPLRREANLHMMVASGPYCKRDSLDYSPLEQVFAHALRTKPRVLLLMGPFLDAGNLKVTSGDTVIPGETNPRPYEEVYTQYILPMLAKGIAPLRHAKPATEVLILPSVDEALCYHPLPQPPLDVSLCVEADSFSRLHSLGVKFLPNPAHLEINGLKVSTCSTDALGPVLREIVLRPPENKIQEGLRLLLNQRTFFPVLPRDPPQVSEARSSALSFAFADDAVPDLCVFPSAIGGATGTFVDGTAFVNPGVLCRGSLGTFAEVVVLPDSSRAAQGGDPLKLSERARVDILKLEGC